MPLKQEATVWACPDLVVHPWIYRGREAQSYICPRCQSTQTKRQLKEATDS